MTLPSLRSGRGAECQLGLAAGLAFGVMLVALARAHDIPNARVDRAIQVTMEPGRLAIDYEVSLAELTLAQDLRSLLGRVPPEITTREALYRRYGEETGILNARGFLASVDGAPVELACDGFDLAIEEHPRFTFHLSTALPSKGRVAIVDTNYAGSEGTSRLAVRVRGDVHVEGYDGPEDVLNVPEKPLWMLSDEEERRTKEVELTFRQVSGTDSSNPAIATAPSGQAAGPPQSKWEPVPEETIGRDAEPPRTQTRLGSLLDRASGASLTALCLAAFVLGAAHAVQPGHGKTLVAAASLGEGGRWTRAVLLATVTTIAHTSGVVLVAAILWLTRSNRYEAMNQVLAGVAGFLIAAIGLWRLGRHLGGHGEHNRDVEAEGAAESGTSVAVRRPGGLIALGLAGGLVPCWDAVLLILLADALGRLGLGLVLLTAFSGGMAVVLVFVGVAMARLGGAFLRRDRDRQARLERRLGLLSGTVLAVLGMIMLWQA